MKKLWILLVLALVLVGCGQEESPRQLCQIMTELSGEKWWIPTWFDPATGELEPVCGEETHGEDCPFRGASSMRAHVVGDTVYYTEEFEGGANVVAYTPGKGTAYNPGVAKKETVATINSPTWRSAYNFKGEYLYIWDRAEDGSKENVRQIHLTNKQIVVMPDMDIPWQTERDIGFFTLEDPDSRCGTGIYTQHLPDGKTEYRPKELLFHSVSFHELCLAPDAIYWQGCSDYDWYDQTEGFPKDLYRYDRATGETTLLIENFGGGIPVALGEYIYAVRHDGTRDVLMQVHGTTGTQKILYTTEEGTVLNRYAPAVVGPYIVVDYTTAEQEDKLVYDTVTGTCKIYNIN